jgi:hypothetical protein
MTGWELAAELESIQATVNRIFLILGAARSGTVPRQQHFMFALGQQFVLKPKHVEQLKADGTSFRLNMSIFQDLILSDMVVVADVSLSARQRSGLAKGPKLGSSAVQLDDPSQVEHAFRFEMAMHHDSSNGNEIPKMRASPWQLVDWNWVCLGNHPVLIPNVPAPW